MSYPLTNGAHHIGLTVSKLEESANFFTHFARKAPSFRSGMDSADAGGVHAFVNYAVESRF